MAKREVNPKIVIQSIAALICLALTFLVNWLFIVPAVVLLWLNQRELLKK